MSPLQIVFTIVTPLSIILILLLFLIKPLRKKYIKNNYIKSYGNTIYKIALNNDYYLINQLILKSTDDNNIIHIDHILFGEKFIYIIKDRYFDGYIEAKENDKSWIFYEKNYKRTFINNPLINNNIRINRFSNYASIDESCLVSIVVINDDCDIEDFPILKPRTYLIKRNKLAKLIATIESQDVEPLNDVQMRLAVKDIARLNKNKKDRA